jgi:hypothetical protein
MRTLKAQAMIINNKTKRQMLGSRIIEEIVEVEAVIMGSMSVLPDPIMIVLVEVIFIVTSSTMIIMAVMKAATSHQEEEEAMEDITIEEEETSAIPGEEEEAVGSKIGIALLLQ